MMRLLLALLALLLVAACASFPKNPPLARYDKDAGYRFRNLAHPHRTNAHSERSGSNVSPHG